jgi:hypothetical protein
MVRLRRPERTGPSPGGLTTWFEVTSKSRSAVETCDGVPSRRMDGGSAAAHRAVHARVEPRYRSSGVEVLGCSFPSVLSHLPRGTRPECKAGAAAERATDRAEFVAEGPSLRTVCATRCRLRQQWASRPGFEHADDRSVRSGARLCLTKADAEIAARRCRLGRAEGHDGRGGRARRVRRVRCWSVRARRPHRAGVSAGGARGRPSRPRRPAPTPAASTRRSDRRRRERSPHCSRGRDRTRRPRTERSGRFSKR